MTKKPEKTKPETKQHDNRNFFEKIKMWFRERSANAGGEQAGWYSIVTVSFLLILIVFQVYWVIGNQLINQLADLLEKESEVNLKIAQNQITYDSLEIIYKQKEIDTESFKTTGAYSFYNSPEWERDTLENLSQRKQLEAELRLYKTQLERNSTILLIWSRPWDDLIRNNSDNEFLIPVTGANQYPNLTAADEYSLQIESIQAQINTIDLQLISDPDGKTEAARLNSILTPELENKEEQLGQLYADNSELYIREAEIQTQIDDINDQLSAISSGAATLDQLNNDLNTQLINLKTQKIAIEQKINEITGQLNFIPVTGGVDVNSQSALSAQLAGLQAEQKTIDSQILKTENQLKAISGNADALKELNAELQVLAARKEFNKEKIQNLQAESSDLIARLVPGGQIVNQWREDKQRLTDELNVLIKQAQADARRESSRQAQLVGQFVLVVLQSYILPLLYGVLGASSYVLRSFSQQIKDKDISEDGRVQNPVRISLGALAGIMVGFLIPTDGGASFIGSVSPLALAFLVGYNIEFFFSLMDVLTNRFKDFLEKPKSDDNDKDQANKIKPKLRQAPAQKGGREDDAPGKDQE